MTLITNNLQPTTNLPKHVALIMDGNRRWARQNKKHELSGHLEGENRIEPIIDYAIAIGIPYLTFWAFSTENWNRSKLEVDFLLKMFRNDLAKKVNNFHQKNVKLNIIGNLKMFPKDLQEKTEEWMKRTKNNTKITVNVALSYGGRDEIIRAINKWHNNLQPTTYNQQLTKQQFSEYLDTKGQPDPDLMIRTGGANRLSGFMLWQMDYAEFYFTDTLWPDFTVPEFKKALQEYENRQRRFGV